MKDLMKRLNIIIALGVSALVASYGFNSYVRADEDCAE